MRDFSAFGRAMHPEFAAQAVFRGDFDDLVDAIYEENSGNAPWRALSLGAWPGGDAAAVTAARAAGDVSGA
jgi:hypothetical protein